ncbi:hypothetical protein [Acidisoma sp. 7E03]
MKPVMAVTGEHSAAVLAARGWETVLGAAMGLFMASAIFPLRPEVPATPKVP